MSEKYILQMGNYTVFFTNHKNLSNTLNFFFLFGFWWWRLLLSVLRFRIWISSGLNSGSWRSCWPAIRWSIGLLPTCLVWCINGGLFGGWVQPGAGFLAPSPRLSGHVRCFSSRRVGGITLVAPQCLGCIRLLIVCGVLSLVAPWWLWIFWVSIRVATPWNGESLGSEMTL